jgi:hypothetical protein
MENYLRKNTGCKLDLSIDMQLISIFSLLEGVIGIKLGRGGDCTPSRPNLIPKKLSILAARTGKKKVEIVRMLLDEALEGVDE